MRFGRREALLGFGGACTTLFAGSVSYAEAAQAAQAEKLAAKIVHVADLVARIADVRAGRLVVLHTGRESLYRRVHVEGARFGGEASTPEGYARLLTAISDVPAATPIVLYCGCCPFEHCANVPGADRALAESRRLENGALLDLPMNFDRDWLDKGYPTAKG